MTADRTKRRRCAVYTRKSSEEGLEQAFNSLDAQREACEAYIKSQAGEGWQLICTGYDDGGVSGGTMDRPALRQLLADIQARKVDTVVVYKVDRLTRSLADFAKIVEVFDARGVSFVSVTQQFNTTTSMGRLTLNMLLSFAQFERVAGTLRRGSGNDAIVALRSLLDRVTVAEDEIQVIVSASGLRNVLGADPILGMDGTPPDDPGRYSNRVPARLKRCGGASRLIITDDDIGNEKAPDPALVRLLYRAHDWFIRLATGKAQSAADIARDEGLTRSYVTRVMRLLRLAFLAPDITKAILAGRQPPDLNAERLVRRSRLPLTWDDQRRLLGLSRR